MELLINPENFVRGVYIKNLAKFFSFWGPGPTATWATAISNMQKM